MKSNTSRWEIEKEFMTMVYHGILMLVFLIITGSVWTSDDPGHFVLGCLSGALAVWKVFVFCAHANHLSELVIKYDLENDNV